MGRQGRLGRPLDLEVGELQHTGGLGAVLVHSGLRRMGADLAISP